MKVPAHITREVYRNAYLADRKGYYGASPTMAGGEIKAMYRRLMNYNRAIWAQAFKECA